MHPNDRKEIVRGWLPSLFLNLLGYRYKGVAVSNSGVTFLSRHPKKYSFNEIKGPLRASNALGCTCVAVTTKSGNEVKAVGFNKSDAAEFITSANHARRAYFVEQVNQVDEEIRSLADAIGRLAQPKRFPSACMVEPFFKRAAAVAEGLPSDIPNNVLPFDQQNALNRVLAFHQGPQRTRDAAIKSFTKAELLELKTFFDKIESNPLTPEQRLAVVTDEDATLVLAGAGSGKTSVIVAKAAYLIKSGIRRPDEILLLAFGKGAATEMATRIEERAGEKVSALTFHALGNYIIRQVENVAPALAAHASDDKQFTAMLREILFHDIAPQPELGALLITWFSEFYWPYKSEWDFETKDEYYQYVEAHELRTLQGELVKSFEEWEIANWLYLNGIAYEYEPDYEHDLPENKRTAYTPDFRLIESGVYIEHFGVRKSRGPTGEVKYTTAPHVDCKAYIEGMDWKRKVHAENGTTLVESFSYERVEGHLTKSLQEKLAPYTKADPIPREQVFERLAELGQVDEFTLVLGTFLRHFKSSGTSVANCISKAEKSREKARGLAFLKIFEHVFDAYQTRLGNRIDFEDMIVRATEHVRAGRFQSPFRHLLVDEFQDISEGRARLLKALLAQHQDARLFAVGDDWQSIYRFTGSDIHLMRDFGKEFGGVFAHMSSVHRSVDLGRTFRSVDKIALPAKKFVLQNPSQIIKEVIPAGQTEKPAIFVDLYGWGGEGAALKTALERIHDGAKGGKTSVLLLGRYNFSEPDDLPGLRRGYSNLVLKFMTVHRSKGLEADHVIVLKASADRMGFPSEIVDDPLLDLVLPEPEEYDHAEERRLFYVALTRARKSVTVLADHQKPSVFLRELLEDPGYGVVALGKAGITKQRCDACGGRMLLQESKQGNPYFQCEHRSLCGEIVRPCSNCGQDLPKKENSDSGTFVCGSGASFSACTDCSGGWLVERSGKWGQFLGCVNFPRCKGKKPLKKRRCGKPTSVNFTKTI